MAELERNIENTIHLASRGGLKCGIELIRNLLNNELESRNNKCLSASEINAIINMAAYQAEASIKDFTNGEVVLSKIDMFMKR